MNRVEYVERDRLVKVGKFLNQQIIVGGCIYTRAELAEEMKREGYSQQCIDITCYSPPPASEIELEMYREQSKILRSLNTVN